MDKGRARLHRAALDSAALVRYPGEGVICAVFPEKRAPGMASISAAEDLAVDATGQQNMGVGGVGGAGLDSPVGGTCSGSRTSAAVLTNIAPSQFTLIENIAGVLLTLGKNVLRLG